MAEVTNKSLAPEEITSKDGTLPMKYLIPLNVIWHRPYFMR